MKIVLLAGRLKVRVSTLVLFSSTMLLASVAFAQGNATIPFSNGGKLAYSETFTDLGPCDPYPICEMYEFTWNNPVYVDPGGHQFPLPYAMVTQNCEDPGDGKLVCDWEPDLTTWDVDVSGNVAGSQLAAVQITFQPSGDNGDSATLDNGTAGWINPKYVIKGVIYAPPGTASSVSYETDTVTGGSNKVTHTFKTAVSNTISGQGNLDVQVGLWGFSTGVKETLSSGWSEEQQSSDEWAWSAKNSRVLKYSAAAPPCPQFGLDHDCDAIVVMLNPVVTFAVFSDGTVGWSGLGYDLADTADFPDVDDQPVWLGCLNGNFYNSYQTMLANGQPNDTALNNSGWGTCVSVFNQNFSRTWAANNVDGSGPALTPTLAQAQSANNFNFCSSQWVGSDLYNICQANPYANPSYAVTFPPGSITTADGRFTACQNSNCTTIFNYFPGESATYSQGYTQTQTSSQTDTYTYSLGFSVESNNGFFGLIGQSMTNSVTWTWTNAFNTSTNNSQTQMASFTIVGPGSGYSGPDQFTVLQDNLFGTFLLKPGN